MIQRRIREWIEWSPAAPSHVQAAQWGVVALLVVASALGQRWFIRIPLIWTAAGIASWLRVRFVKRQVAQYARAVYIHRVENGPIDLHARSRQVG